MFLMHMRGGFEMVEYQAHDVLFQIKSRFAPSSLHAPMAIVAMDDATLADDAFRLPLSLLHEHLAEVIRGLADAGAALIALDFLLPQDLFDDQVPGYSKSWLQALLYARTRGVPLITGYVEMEEQRFLPHPYYLQIIGKERLGLFNLTTDHDDVIRRHRAYYETQDKTGTVATFAALVAQEYGKSRENTASHPETVIIDFLPEHRLPPLLSLGEVYGQCLAGNGYLRTHFKDVIVFIGSTHTLSQDRFPTPLHTLFRGKSEKQPGVALHAQIANTLLGGVYFVPVTPWITLAILLSLTLCTALANVADRPLLSAGAAIVALLGYSGACLVSFMHYKLLPLTAGLTGIALTYGSTLLCQHVLLDREKRKLSRTFRRFLPPDIVRRLLATRDADFFKGQEKRLCILFSDIRQFTAYAEKRKPAEVVARLNEYFEQMSIAVAKNGGIVDKFLGDGLLAFFGVLEEKQAGHDSGAPGIAAVRAAEAMLHALDDLNAQWASRGEEPFDIGMGLHTGMVMVGNIGSHHKMEFTVIGDAVNLAARLQEQTKKLGERVILSKAVRDDLGPEFVLQQKGTIDIRGHSPVTIFALKPRGSQ